MQPSCLTCSKNMHVGFDFVQDLQSVTACFYKQTAIFQVYVDNKAVRLLINLDRSLRMDSRSLKCS